MKHLSTILLAATLAATTTACAKKVQFKPSSLVPAAQAEVSVDTDKNGNAILHLEVDHLATADSLIPPRSVYVVWAASTDGRITNVGALKVSKKLHAELESLAPYPEFSVFITAEDSPHMEYPTGQRVLETDPVKVK